MSLSAGFLESALARFEPLRRIYVAYSGGIDSHVLLHLAASSPRLHDRITAVYVHHGLQPDADAWAAHTAKTAEELAVGFILLRVDAVAGNRESPEEAARNARYAALKDLVDVDDALLSAQHLEDQLETVLLQLMRGSGLRGLSGMPESMAFGRGRLLRPLLQTPKRAIFDYADRHRLHWVEDPTNQRSDYDRNFLRNEVLPLLKQRWPGCAVTVARAARHCAEAETLVTELAGEIFEQIFDPADNTLSISRLRMFDGARQQLAVRRWFQVNGLRMPSRDFVLRLLNQVAAARDCGHPALLSQGCWIRRYRDKLYCLAESEPEIPKVTVWPPGRIRLPIGERRVLHWRQASAGIALETWLGSEIVVKPRSGGEKIRLPGRAGRHSLKNLYQEAGIPPWEREKMPLVYLNGRLAAIGDRWVSAEFYATKKDGCVELSMEDPTLR
ncbi:tRNA lysidine(34) synthetase TilS [Methylosarcina fibrata]|uniref:tRNA lysidine(34) synthetase TilS n=1 Tax=Methylosarcina fibrata TaxID=105972 RepID=UPI000361047F|nr:tRNA lysidine(34) synthetase TilS [Methylosarcina fibrata]